MVLHVGSGRRKAGLLHVVVPDIVLCGDRPAYLILKPDAVSHAHNRVLVEGECTRMRVDADHSSICRGEEWREAGSVPDHIPVEGPAGAGCRGEEGRNRCRATHVLINVVALRPVGRATAYLGALAVIGI